MATYVALLRGIAPTNPKMQNAELRKVFEASGFAIVLIAAQDRALWDGAMISEGLELLNRSIARTDGAADNFQLQAAIAACHARAANYDDTDWLEIARLYELLEEVNPSPVVRLNRAVAVAESQGAEAGLQLLEDLDVDTFRLNSVRAELLLSAGRTEAAIHVFRIAIAAAGPSTSNAELAHLKSRLDSFT